MHTYQLAAKNTYSIMVSTEKENTSFYVTVSLKLNLSGGLKKIDGEALYMMLNHFKKQC